jgi:hypothetical protein
MIVRNTPEAIYTPSVSLPLELGKKDLLISRVALNIRRSWSPFMPKVKKSPFGQDEEEVYHGKEK